MANKCSTKFMSDKQEKRVAEEISGRRVVASGSKWGSKGDVRGDLFLVECKTTKHTFYTLNVNTWLKIQKEATKDGLRIPLMCIDLENGKTRLCVFGAETFSADTFNFNGNYRVDKSVRIDETMVGKHLLLNTHPEIVLEVEEWEDAVYEICKGACD